MATANFGKPNFDLPLIAVGMTDDEEQNQIEFWEMENSIEDINSQLTYLEVFAESGYYQGAMYNCREKYDYIDFEDVADLDDEDANYFFGDTAEQVKKDFADDMNKVQQFLKDRKENGALELIKTAQFSNGEALYKAV